VHAKAVAAESDAVVHRIVTRANVAPGTTTDAGWADDLAASAAGDFFTGLAPASAAARLIAAGTMVTLEPRLSLTFPRRATPPAAGLPWVAEGGPILVTQFTIAGGATLGPTRKFAVLLTLSEELARRSAAEAVFTFMLREAAAFTLDSAVFNTAAGSASAHAGLLKGVTPLEPSGDMDTDLAALLAALAESGGTNAVIVAAPAEAAALQVRRRSCRCRCGRAARSPTAPSSPWTR
jgi:hypothetical protein